MWPLDIGAPSKISDRPRYLHNAVHRTRRQLQQIDRVFQHGLIVRREPAHRVGFRLIEMRVAAARPLSLHLACTHDASANHVAGFAGRCVGAQFGRRQSRDFEMQVDAFEQRAGDLGAVALDRVGMTAVAAGRIAGPAAVAERRCLFLYVRIRRKSLIQQAWDFEPKSLGDHIRRRRLILSITQEEAAALLRVNTWTVHNWETGHSKPVIQFIPALVGFLGYDPESIDMETLAEQLVAKRRELGISQREAARLIGVDPATWAGWELGGQYQAG
jgi:DNA-binding transcriptional regulator YiaG